MRLRDYAMCTLIAAIFIVGALKCGEWAFLALNTLAMWVFP